MFLLDSWTHIAGRIKCVVVVVLALYSNTLDLKGHDDYVY